MIYSAVVLTHNCADSLSGCLSSLSSAKEIIIIDDLSTDNTLKIAKKFTPHIYSRHLNNDFAAQRNFGLAKTKSDWVMFLDSDEILSPPLKQAIAALPNHPSVNGYYIPRQDLFLSQTIHFGEMGHTRLLRLGNKNYGSWTRSVHEIWKISPPLTSLFAPIFHRRHISLTSFINRLNSYTDINRGQLLQENKGFSYKELLKPPIKFLYNYFFLLGFLDGMPGLIAAYMMSFHSLIVRVKLWESND